jgi:CRISPR-associated endonuclease/helicase Cas3
MFILPPQKSCVSAPISSSSSVIPLPDVSNFASWEVFSLALNVAAIFHDLGKANERFQRKLQSAEPVSDPIRHEILSAVLFLEWIDKDGDPVEDFNSLLGKALPITHKIKVDNGLQTLTSLIFFLIATHHRLLDVIPGKGKIPGNCPYILTEHTQKKNLHPDDTVILPAVLTPFLRDSLISIDRDAVRQVLAPAIWEGGTVYCRLALILADQLASRMPFDADFHPGLRPSFSELIANTESGSPKQTLDEHTQKVVRAALPCLRDIFEAPRAAPCLDRSDLPNNFREKSSGQFAWQGDAQMCLDHAGTDGGVFAVVTTGTGTGKTVGGAKIMAALRPKVRYAALSPLRSLTLQTGAQYRNKLGVKKSDIGVVIGSRALSEIYNKTNLMDEHSSFTGFDEDDLTCEVDGDVSRLPPQLARHIKRKASTSVSSGLGIHAKNEAFLASPIIIATIDQIMKASDSRRTGYTMAALRLLTSDLLIDEIDAFDGASAVAVGRLIKLAGLLGRNVVICSATIAPAQIRAFFRAFNLGHACNVSVFGRSGRAKIALISENKPTRMAVPKDRNGADILINEFCNELVGELSQKTSPRFCEYLPRDLAVNPIEYFSGAFESARTMHRRHASEIEGRRVSIQLVSLANVDTCVAFAQFLDAASVPDTMSISHIVYHSRIPLLLRSKIEEFLDNVLTRGGQKPHEALSAAAEFQALLARTSARDVMIIVVATSVEEMGRDHDFDAATIEVRSFRSLIQIAGRVQRHRMTRPPHPNLALLPSSFRQVQKPGTAKPFSMPGIEEDDENLQMSFRLKSPWISEVVSNEVLKNINARCRFDEASESPMSQLEHRKLREHLEGSKALTLPGAVNPDTLLSMTHYHLDRIRLRESNATVSAYFDPVRNKIAIHDPRRREDLTVDCIQVSDEKSPRAFFSRSELSVIRSSFPDELSHDERSVHAKYLAVEFRYSAVRKLHYNTDFGLHHPLKF